MVILVGIIPVPGYIVFVKPAVRSFISRDPGFLPGTSFLHKVYGERMEFIQHARMNVGKEI